jgi:DNA replication protein DnaC
VALAVKVAQAGHSIYFTTMADLVTKLKEDESSGRNIKARSHSKAALVVVDEVGYTPIDRRGPAGPTAPPQRHREHQRPELPAPG